MSFDIWKLSNTASVQFTSVLSLAKCILVTVNVNNDDDIIINGLF